VHVRWIRPAVPARSCPTGRGTRQPWARRARVVLPAIAFSVALTSCGTSNGSASRGNTGPTGVISTTRSPSRSVSTTKPPIRSVSTTRPSSGSTPTASTSAGSGMGKSSPGKLAVPSIINQAPAQAVIVLSQVGLQLGITKYDHTAEVERGLIIESVPSAGTLVEPHSRINVIVSLGCLCSRPPPVTVPNVTGDTLASAEAALSQSGLGWTITYQSSQVVGEGLVISSSPAGGDQSQVGRLVALTISRLPLIPWHGGLGPLPSGSP
jgi:PASTA domain